MTPVAGVMIEYVTILKGLRLAPGLWQELGTCLIILFIS